MVTIKSTLSSGTLFNIQDQGSTNLVTFKPVRAIYYIVFSSSDLKNGSSYNIYTGGSSTGTYTNGIYVGGSYSGGTKKSSFTVSKTVTSVSF
jgi:trimeric autotransporter adhesin